MDYRFTNKACILAIMLLLGVLPASANVTLCQLFSNNMVIQRNKTVLVYGTASPGESVSVAFNAQTKSTTADVQGDWKVYLAPMSANATGQTMTVTSTNTISITNVIIGDVWLVSGQSNMTMPLSASGQTADETSANFPGIRRFYRGGTAISESTYPTKDLAGSSWIVCSPSTAPNFPATAFYFARKIYQDQNGAIPIGLIEAARGSTDIDVWVCPESIVTIPLLQPLLGPSTASNPPFSYFNSLVYPIEPFAIYGFIWWQGESREVTSQSVDSYFVKERAVIQGWRHLWGGEELPFYIVQLANYETAAVGSTPDLVSTHRNDTRVQQTNVLYGLPRTGMAVAIDVGDATNIHPPDKYDIGERLALWALKNDYGRTTIVESGPILKDVTVSGNTLVCTFDYGGSGLMVGSKVQYQPTQEVAGGTLARFSIAGSNGVWYDGSAVISGNTVVVSSPSVPSPTKLAYAHWPNPTGCNLYNKEGLPASPFYVDDVNAKYTVTASAGSGGSISPAGAATYLKRRTALYTITPDANYYIQDVKVDGVSVGAVKRYTFDPLYANHTISATFTAATPTYTITASAGAGGSLSESGSLTLAQGSSQSFKIIPNSGCYIDTVTVDGVSVGNRQTYTFADIRANHTISASFECKITAIAGYGGAISPAGTTDVPYGTSKTFTITPNPGFTTTNVIVDRVSKGVISSYTFENVTGPHTISATFSGGGGTQDGVPCIYDLLFSVNTDSLPASGNTGSWATYIPSGKSLTAARGTPSVEVINGVKWEKNVYSEYDGYRMGPYSNPIVNIGASIVMAIRPTIDTTVTDTLYGVSIFNDRLTIGFKSNTGQVFVTRNGTTNTSTYTLTNGQPVILSIVAQPDGKYKVWVNGNQVMDITTTSDITALTPYGNSVYVTLADSDTTGVHTFNGNIGDTFVYLVALSDTDRHQLEGILTSKFVNGSSTTYTISASAGSGGSISPSGAVTVNQGTSKSFAITPSGGYVVNDVLVDGSSVGAVPSYTFNSISANHTISASFRSVPSVTITASAGTGGSISPSGAVAVTSGGSQSFNITPNLGYTIEDVKVDSVSIGAEPSYTFSNVTVNHTISATFNSVPPLTISASSGPGGSVSPSGAVSVNYGASQTFTITPNTGYRISDVQVDDTSIGVVPSYTFNNVTANHVFNADFEPLPIYTITASAGNGGSISPAGSVSVTSGSSQTFTITTNTGYTLADVKVDNVSIGANTSYTFSNVTANHTMSASFNPLPTGVPRTDQLVGSWITNALPTSGAIINWTSYLPTGQTLNKVGSPTVDTINGVKWAYNHYSSYDGHDMGPFASTYTIPCSGASVVMAVKPIRTGKYDSWTSCFSVFTYTLSFGVRNDTGNICARRNNNLFNYPSAVIPDGQITVLSCIVQPEGNFKVYANGTQIVNEAATSSFTEILQTWSTSDTMRHITIGRAYPANWSTFNGDIGDTYFYKTALSDIERKQLETELTNKYINYKITASAGEGGSISPSGTVYVSPGVNQSFTIIPNAGYVLSELKVDGVAVTPAGSYTFNAVSDNHTIAVAFMKVEKPYGVNNKTVLNDSKLQGKPVHVWGKVKSDSRPDFFTIDDGYGIPVIIKVDQHTQQSQFGVGSFVVVTGIRNQDKSVQAQFVK